MNKYKSQTREWRFNKGIGPQTEKDFEFVAYFERQADINNWKANANHRLEAKAAKLEAQFIDACWTFWQEEPENTGALIEAGIYGAISKRYYNCIPSLQAEVEYLADELGDNCAGIITKWTAGDETWQ